jgi:hypothetical protein
MASFGESPAARSIDTFRNSTHPNWYWLRSGKRPHDPKLASFGESPLAQSIATFRNSTHHNGPMGSFGETVRGRFRPLCRPIMPRYPLGSFGKTPLASFGEHPTDPIRFVWGKLVRPEYRHFSELNTSELVLASFGETAPSPQIGFVRGKPTRPEHRRFSELNTS